MALQPQSISAAAFNDNDAGGNNYFAGKAIYIYDTDGSFASVYSDSGGLNLISQNGINNITGDNGVFTFYIDGGEYYAQSDGERVGFWVTNAELIESYAVRAEEAAAQASTDSNIFDTVALGEAGTVSGDWFSVPSDSDNGAFDYYKNEGGVGVYKKTSSTADAVSNSFDNVVNYTYENFVSGGDFIGGEPDMRSDSDVITLTDQQELLSRGYKKGIKWRNGNDFARASIGENIDGKHVAGCFLIYSENPANLPSGGEVMYSENASGTQQLLINGEVKFISISDKLKLAYRYGTVNQSDAVNLLLGSTTTPADTERYATGFFATVSDIEFDVLGFIADALIRDKCRLDNYKVSESMGYATEVQLQQEVTNSSVTSLQNVFSNEFGFGDFVSGTPEIRSGSNVVDIDKPDLSKLGLYKAVNWRVGGNEHALTQNIENLNGKYAFVGFYAYNENPADLPSGAFSFTVSDAGALAGLDDQGIGYVDINENLRFCWFKGLVDDDDAVKFAIGDVYAPTTSTLYASGYYMITSESEINTEYALKSVFITDRCRKQISTNVKTAQYSSVSIGEAGEFTVVKGKQGEQSVSRYLLPFPSNGLDGTQVFNFSVDKVDDATTKIATDDVAPQRAFGTTIGANHGFIMGKYLVPSHDKDDDDVGSVYAIGSEQFVILGIRTPDTLWIAHFSSNSASALISGNFTHVGGGVNQTSFSGTFEDDQQFYPPFQNYSMVILVDGEAADAGEYKYADKVKFLESYDVLDRPEIIDWYINDRQSGEFKPYGKDPSYSASMIYEFDIEANCTFYSDITFFKDTLVQDLMFMQATVEEIDRYYIPKTLPFAQGGQSFDYNLIEDARKISSNSVGTVYFNSSKVESSGLLMDRYIGLNDDSNTLFSMGYLPIKSAENTVRRANTTAFAWEIRGTSDKMYPRIVDKGDFTALAGEHYSMIGYRNVAKKLFDMTSAYPVRSTAGDYYYMDWHGTEGNQRIELPSDYQGRDFEVVESKNATTYNSSSTSSILVNVDALGSYGFLTIKMTS